MGRGGRFVVTALLVLIAFAGVSARADAAQKVNNPYNGTWQCCGAGGAGQQEWVINGNSGEGIAPGGTEFATIAASYNYPLAQIVTTYTASSYVATFNGSISADGDTMTGTWTSNAGQSGTWTAHKGGGSSASPLTVSLSLSSLTFPVGGTVLATVTVTAGAEALSNVSLGTGLVVDSNFVTITKSPPSLDVSSIAAGSSQSFVFTLTGVGNGGDVMSVSVTADDVTGSVSDSSESKYDVGTFPGFPTPNSGPAPAAAPIASTLGTPGEIFHSIGHNVANASITVAAILFITFPANIFNNTFSSNYDEILLIFAGWRRKARRAFGLKAEPIPGEDELGPALTSNGGQEAAAALASPATPNTPGLSSRTWFYAVLVMGAILGGLLNPHFGLNRESLAGFGATMVAFAIGAGLSWFIAKLFRQHHHYATHTYLKALPLGLAVAALCVVISRVSNFQPGYLYGIVVSIAFVETLADRHNAHLTVISTISTLVVALLAWFAWVPINHLALDHSANIPIAILDDVLGSIFIGGLVGSVVGLMPLQFMPGGTLLRWRKDVWAIVFFLALFLLVEVELNPASGPTHQGGAPIVTVIVLFVGFGGSTWWMRRYFSKRLAAKHTAPAPAGAPLTSPYVEVDPLLDTDSGDDDEYS
jgi:hypothetical protein